MEDLSICQQCKGECCKRIPGCYFPEDVELNVPFIAKMLQEDMATIDWWEGNVSPGDEGPGYYLRAKAINDESYMVGSWGGECVHLTLKGCKLSHDERPKDCRELVPAKNFICSPANGLTKYDAVLAWTPYRQLLLDAVKKVEKNFPSRRKNIHSKWWKILWGEETPTKFLKNEK